MSDYGKGSPAVGADFYLVRLFDKIDVGPGCWEWVASRNVKSGYGYIKPPQPRQPVPAHRAVYEALVGPIPDGYQIDHLCKNRGCVNPDHLEAVTPQVNVLRSSAPTALHAAKVGCPKCGKPYDAILYREDGRPRARRCTDCINARRRERRSPKLEKACARCSVRFIPGRSDARYCGKACRRAAQVARRKLVGLQS